MRETKRQTEGEKKRERVCPLNLLLLSLHHQVLPCFLVSHRQVHLTSPPDKPSLFLIAPPSWVNPPLPESPTPLPPLPESPTPLPSLPHSFRESLTFRDSSLQVPPNRICPFQVPPASELPPSDSPPPFETPHPFPCLPSFQIPTPSMSTSLSRKKHHYYYHHHHYHHHQHYRHHQHYHHQQQWWWRTPFSMKRHQMKLNLYHFSNMKEKGTFWKVEFVG